VNVRELIAELENVDENLEVWVTDSDEGTAPAQELSTEPPHRGDAPVLFIAGWRKRD
jgi:hypothetical protein